jgi:YggT family protein
MASPHADPASAPPLLLAIRHIPFPGVHQPRAFPSPDLAPLARRLDELAAAAAAHPLLKPLFDFHDHLSTFSQVRYAVTHSLAESDQDESRRSNAAGPPPDM